MPPRVRTAEERGSHQGEGKEVRHLLDKVSRPAPPSATSLGAALVFKLCSHAGTGAKLDSHLHGAGRGKGQLSNHHKASP